MSLKSIVKVSHLSNLSDTRYCAGMGVELIGFGAIPGTEFYLEPGIFQDIRGWISGPRIVAELYGISSTRQIQSAIETYAPDYFELTFDEFKTFRNDLALPCIVYFPLTEEVKSAPATEGISHVIVDEQTSCSHIASVSLPILINVKSLEKLEQKLSEGCFQGFVLEGPRELRPGITNYDQLGAILEALEEE